MWVRRITSVIIFGIGIGLGATSIWVWSKYAALPTTEITNLTELPVPFLIMPEIDPNSGNYKHPIDEPIENLARRVTWRASRIGGIGLILIVGGCSALLIPRHRADYRVSTFEMLGYVATIAFGLGFLVSSLCLPLAAATLGFGIGGRLAFWPSLGIGLVIEIALLFSH